MASAAASGQFLAERVDIHKSCKSLETLLNVLNDYCEAAGAVVLLQKKLAKALRETANLKVTGEIASNAMIASATIFDALSDIDSKFAKIADKEYDGISAEVKKWFKKLAKEEKAHDDRLSSANAKIKQAGQIYEKKSKKNPRDSADEHARYINLISSLGPEISQEKYNHTLQVTQRHTSTTYSVAACWLRTCEGVRRFSPTIGPLGEWRALCEGGWTGPIPPSLRESRTQSTMRNINPTEAALNTPLPSYGRDQTPATSPFTSPNPARANLPPPSSFEPPRAFVDANSGSVRSLSAFPPPPTHFPVPSRQQKLQQASSSSYGSNAHLLTFPPQPDPESEAPRRKSPPRCPHLRIPSTPRAYARGDYLVGDAESRAQSDSPERNGVERSDTGGSSTSVVANMRNRYSTTSGATSPAPKDIPRLPLSVTDLATRYQPMETPPVSPRARASSPPVSSRPPMMASSVDKFAAAFGERPSGGGYNSSRSPMPSPSTSKYAAEEENRRRSQQHDQRIDEAAELEFLEKEKALQEKEREIGMRAQELELEREKLRNIRSDGGQRDAWESGATSPMPQLRPRERKTDLSRSRRTAHNRTTILTRIAPRTLCLLLAPLSKRTHPPLPRSCSVAQYKSSSNRAPSPNDLRPPEKPFNLRPEKPKGWIRRLSMPVAVGNAFNLDNILSALLPIPDGLYV
ncbi:hypothetical protein C8R46DRAFT_1178136 [Mycena filopes]|nr:hypothetical protein C8R46DRAFT_1178136 [Mycena filopes]